MDIYTYLKKDHNKVARLFKKIILSTSSKERENNFLEIRKELELHADPEHATFYDSLQKHSFVKDDVAHGDKEHEAIKKALAKLSKIPSKETVKWLVQLGELKYMVDHHVEEEETNLFEKAKKILSKNEANELAMRMEELKNNMRKTTSFQKKFNKTIKNKRKN